MMRTRRFAASSSPASARVTPKAAACSGSSRYRTVSVGRVRPSVMEASRVARSAAAPVASRVARSAAAPGASRVARSAAAPGASRPGGSASSGLRDIMGSVTRPGQCDNWMTCVWRRRAGPTASLPWLDTPEGLEERVAWSSGSAACCRARSSSSRCSPDMPTTCAAPTRCAACWTAARRCAATTPRCWPPRTTPMPSPGRWCRPSAAPSSRPSTAATSRR